MALGTTLALMMLMQAPANVVDQADASNMKPVDVAFEELSGGQNEIAIERIEQNSELDNDDPARLINLGIAHARQGDDIRARALFTAAAMNESRYQLETAQGDWVDSRVLARRALSMMNRGDFRTTDRVASR